MDINLQIVKLLDDGDYQRKASDAFRQGSFFDVFDNNQYRENYPYIVSEENFLKMIEKSCESEKFKEIFKNIEPFILNNQNINDFLFERLLMFAKDKNEWIYLGLCHANLSEEKNEKLKALGLDECLWY